MTKWLCFLVTLVVGLVAWTGIASAQERCPFAINGAIEAGDATQTGRLKNGQASTCQAPKTVPDLQAPIVSRRFDSYTLKNRSTAAACVTISLTPDALGAALSAAAYVTAFDPANPQTNYLGDSGNVGAGVTQTFGVNVPALSDFVVIVTEVGGGGGAYALGVADCGSIVVTSVTPNSGSIIGGTAITVAGSGFLAGATVTVGGNAATAVTVNGDASISATTPAGAAGPADVVVTNPGGASSTLTGGFVYVAPAQTTLTLQSSANPSVVGQNVTFTANATAAVGGPVTGSITFKDGAATLGTGTLNNGVATFSTTALAIGTHPITATFAGDISFSAATSGTVNQVVTTGSTATALAVAPNPAVVGNAIAFNVTVTATAPATGVPTGNVTVTANGNAVGAAVALDNTGKATLSSSTLAAGTYTVVATYAGDAKFASSVSAPVTLVVNATGTDGGASSSGGSSGGSSGTSGTTSSGGSSGTSGASSSGAASSSSGNAASETSGGGGGCDCNTTSTSTSLSSAALWALAAVVKRIESPTDPFSGASGGRREAVLRMIDRCAR